MKYTVKDVNNMRIASAVSFMSKDTSTKVGCVIVGKTGEPLSWGFNGFPRKVNDDVKERYIRPLKYKWTEHSERNAIYNAARTGTSLVGGKIYITSLIPCVDCSRAIIQSGIKEVFVEKKAFDKSNTRSKAWLEDWPICVRMFKEAGVSVTTLPNSVTQFQPHKPSLLNRLYSWYKRIV